MVARLQDLKVPYQPTGDGYTILVPKAEQYTAKLALAQAGLPKGSSVGMELFDEPKFGATEFDRKVNYLRAQQGELERALVRISELEYANVKLAIPERSVFLRDQQPVTAAVLVQPRPGRKLTPDQVLGIVNFVTNSVQGLTAENVSVVDNTGRVLSTGALDALSQGIDAEQLQRQEQMEQEMERKLRTLLEPVFGPGNVVARVSLTLNFDASRIETSTVGQSVPKSTTTTRETAQGQTNATDPARPNEPGAPPVYQGQTQTGTTDQWKTSTKTDYEVSQKKETILVAPGTVKRLSAAITINRTDLSADEIRSIKEIASGATGALVQDIAVMNMAFNRDVPVDLAIAPERPLQPLSLAIGLGAAAALMLVGFVVTRRRKDDDLAEALPVHIPPGTSLDVALGSTGEAATVTAAPENPLQALIGTAAALETDSSDQADPETKLNQSPKKRLEILMASNAPKRQIVLGDTAIPEELKDMIHDLINETPESCAEIIKQWLKAGSTNWNNSQR